MNYQNSQKSKVLNFNLEMQGQETTDFSKTSIVALDKNLLENKNISKFSEKESDKMTSFFKLDKFEKKNGRSRTSLMARAAIYFNKKNYIKALYYFQKVAMLRYDNEILTCLIKCYKFIDDLSGARVHFQDAKPSLGESETFWQLWGYLEFELENFDDAFKYFFEAKKLGSVDEKNMLYLVRSLKKVDKTEELLKVLEQLIQEDFQDKEIKTYIMESYAATIVALTKFKDGVHFFESEKFDWSENAILNACAAICYQGRGCPDDVDLAYKLNEKALELDPGNVRIRWNHSLNQLRAGDLRGGMENYKIRFEWPEFPSPRRTFAVPRWHENVNKYARILVWTEQGIGDELLFSTAMNSFIEEYPNVIFETHGKTCDVLSESFPSIHVRPFAFKEDLSAFFDDFQYEVPIGDVFWWFIEKKLPSLEKGECLSGLNYLKPDKLRKFYWNSKLENKNIKPKVGFCWSSQNLDGIRETMHTTIDVWRPMLQREDVDFVSLQYNVDYEDLEKQHSEYSHLFLDTGFLDQKDDIEGALALIANLDLVITSPSAPYILSGASGVETWYYSTPSPWMLGRAGKFVSNPILPNMKNYQTNSALNDKQLPKDFNLELDRFVTKFHSRKHF